jgi:hypothetical protein
MTSTKKRGKKKYEQESESDKRPTSDVADGGGNNKTTEDTKRSSTLDTIRRTTERKGETEEFLGRRISSGRTMKKKKEEKVPQLSQMQRQELIDHIDEMFNTYALAIVNAMATVGTVRSVMLTRTKARHNERVADIIKDIDAVVEKHAKRSVEADEGSLVDVMAALMYYAIVAHAFMVQNNEEYKKVSLAAQKIVEQALMSTMTSTVEDEDGEEEKYQTYTKDKDFVDPSVR